jgi:hypothetical protein
MADRGRPKNLTTMLRDYAQLDKRLKSSDVAYLHQLADKLGDLELLTVAHLLQLLNEIERVTAEVDAQ